MKVLCLGLNDKVTWEPESNVTQEMLEDYKRQEDSNDKGDQTKDNDAKRRRTDTDDKTVQDLE